MRLHKSQYIPFYTLPELSKPEIECLWLKLRPHRLPRELSGVFGGVTYHPSRADNNVLQDYLISTTDHLLAKHPNAGIMLMGDFNQFDYKLLCRYASLV